MKFNPYYYTKQEQRGIFIIIIIIILIGLLRFDIYRHSLKSIQYNYTPIIPIQKEQKSTKSTENPTYTKNDFNHQKSKSNSKPKPVKDDKSYLKKAVPFNPNLVTEQQLSDMQFPENGIKNLIKYRAKNGVIKSVSHFKQIWGFEDIDSAFLDTTLLFPKPQKTNLENKEKQTAKNIDFIPITKNYQSTKTEDIIVELNQADTSQLKTIRGIGSYRAMKIIQYRDLLGGFYSIDQLQYVDWLPDSTFQKIKHQFSIDTSNINPINVNSISLDDLAKHPYISYSQARMIANFIIEHGPLEDKIRLYQLRGFDSIDIQRLLPYFSVKSDK